MNTLYNIRMLLSLALFNDVPIQYNTRNGSQHTPGILTNFIQIGILNTMIDVRCSHIAVINI